MTITKNGLELAERLIRFNPNAASNTEAVREVCSRICRHGATIKRLAEAYCNREMSEAEQETDKACEARIRELVGELQLHGCKHVTGVEFQGDPRGATVKLKVNDRSGDSFGGDDRMVVPGS